VVNLAKSNKARTRLQIRATDPRPATGVALMQVTTNKRRPGKFVKFTRSRKIKRGSKRLFVRVRDKAGNVSAWRPERRGNR
jgi:hypothetical protein